MTNKSTTQYVQFTGKAYWAHIYKPDTFRGAVRWIMNLYMDDDEWKKFKDLKIQKKPVTDENGTFWRPTRLTSRMIKEKLVKFTPPWIYDKNGEPLVTYVNQDGKEVRSYDGADSDIKRVGDPVLIGNGSTVSITVSVYPTTMGIGNRLESIRLLDLIEYKSPEVKDEDDEALPF
jgi:hypothetical protein